ncbi:MAG TPA: hypothetical protein VMF65_19605, partial [Acidimicrobiales bacterium]|nr:hypothetical protein [Acidimicrobiales bacterium]
MATPQADDDFGTGRRPDPNRPTAEFGGPEPLPRYQVVEVTVCTPPPPPANRWVSKTNSPQGWAPVSVL